jgi:hypothetical protein
MWHVWAKRAIRVSEHRSSLICTILHSPYRGLRDNSEPGREVSGIISFAAPCTALLHHTVYFNWYLVVFNHCCQTPSTHSQERVLYCYPMDTRTPSFALMCECVGYPTQEERRHSTDWYDCACRQELIQCQRDTFNFDIAHVNRRCQIWPFGSITIL